LDTFDFEIHRIEGLESLSLHFDSFDFHKDLFEVGMIVVEDSLMFGVVVVDKDLVVHRR